MSGGGGIIQRALVIYILNLVLNKLFNEISGRCVLQCLCNFTYHSADKTYFNLMVYDYSVTEHLIWRETLIFRSNYVLILQPWGRYFLFVQRDLRSFTLRKGARVLNSRYSYYYDDFIYCRSFKTYRVPVFLKYRYTVYCSFCLFQSVNTNRIYL